MAEPYSTSTDNLNYHRRNSREVNVGNLPLGGSNPVRIQTMADVDTLDVEKAIAQAVRVAEKGAEYFRFTAQGVKQAEALGEIHAGIRQRGYSIPLIADIHFNPLAAFEALMHVEKVRINPGNFAELKPPSGELSEEYLVAVQQQLEEKFGSFVEKAKKLHRAIRIGTNHGSLSPRMLHLWGNTPQGMVESALEYLEICFRHHFYDVVISMKSSNVLVMTEAVHLLVDRLAKEGKEVPLHLGVTEAGESEDGRIKSAVGIGSLLADGIGDTIRVSLSEAPEEELPVARKIVAHIQSRSRAPLIEPYCNVPYRRNLLPRAEAYPIKGMVEKVVTPVWVRGVMSEKSTLIEAEEDLLLAGKDSLEKLLRKRSCEPFALFRLDASSITPSQLRAVKESSEKSLLLLYAPHPNRIGHWRNALSLLAKEQIQAPIILALQSEEEDFERFLLETSIDLGSLLLDGIGSGLYIENRHFDQDRLYRLGLGILQAARIRFSHAEFISCPGCGRTLFALHQAVADIKANFSHLKNLKIGIMGCIVNGPGEMADADYGYVGGAPGKIDLYKGHVVRKRNVPQSEAVSSLIQLIKEEGDWQEP